MPQTLTHTVSCMPAIMALAQLNWWNFHQTFFFSNGTSPIQIDSDQHTSSELHKHYTANNAKQFRLRAVPKCETMKFTRRISFAGFANF